MKTLFTLFCCIAATSVFAALPHKNLVGQQPSRLSAEKMRPAKADDDRNLYILSIGPNIDKQLLTDKDAYRFKSIFSGQKRKLYTHIESDVLTGRSAGTSNIAKKILEVTQQQFKPNDVVIVFISGHTFVKDHVLRLTCSDFQTTLPERTSLNIVNEIIKPLTLLPCKVLFFFDINDGGLLRTSSVVKDSVKSANMDTASTALSLARLGAAKKNFSIITSTSDSQVSQEDKEWQGGAFIKILDDALSSGSADADNNGVITFNEIFMYEAKNLPDLVTAAGKKDYNGKLITQNPVYIPFTDDVVVYIK